ncbi:hypothetical protein GCM10011400_09890 [Paraburkholderia caffeinilytica]|uniref:Uncharacterized protein n=1 Tax=Paraburkholderia caffeinilytica TaxID=1761016 RepID=A0ABQ1LMR4_9BURK|nr:hypothetical protein GCM10011400_09890 [Paraburkholderia caffeinilytica]
MHDAPARAGNPVQQRTDAGADARDNAIRQESKRAQQTCHQTDEDSTFHEATTRWMLCHKHAGRGNLTVVHGRSGMRARQTGLTRRDV